MMMRALLLLPIVLAGIGPAGAADLAIRRVMLSSAGVGYFEYEAAVDGPASLGLEVKLDQVDDVLKSLVVFDAQGGVGAVELPGRDDRRNVFGQVPFGPEGLASPLAFLNSLQGIELAVEGPRPMQGRLLRAETVHEPAASPGQEGPVRTRVTLLTGAGLKQFVLEDSDAVQVADPALRQRIEQALAATRRESAQDARRLTLTTLGAGPRTVRASYVSVAPLWKASYRLLLPDENADPASSKARLQGWATLENSSSADWSGVSLALQYGNPVTFHQAIYRSYFVTRPEVPVEVLGRLLPDVDSGKLAPPAPPPPPAPTVFAPAPSAAAGMMQRALRRPEPKQEDTLADASGGAVTQEAATETIFTLSHPIDLPAGHSATVPILDQNLQATRVDLATPDQAHPLAAIRLLNETGSSLPPGVLAIYDPKADAPYAGDARLGGVPQGESRLVAYAQDLRTSLAWRREDSVAVASLTAADGVMQVDQRTRQITHALVNAPPHAARRVLVEVSKPDGVTVAPDFAQPVEETASTWRFAIDLQPGEAKELTYGLDRHERQSIELLDEEDSVASVLNLQGLSPGARTGLERVAGLRAQEAARTAERDDLTAKKTALDADETRLRANLGVLQPTDALRTRLLRQLDADETRQAQLDAALATANDAIAQAHRTLADAVKSLRL